MLNPFEDLKNELLQEFKTLLENNTTTIVQQPIEQPLTTDELSKFLRVSVPTIIRMKKSGKLPYLELGGSIRFDKNDVKKAMEKNKK